MAARLTSPYASRPGSACSNDRWSITSPPNFNVGSMTANPPPAYVALAAAQQIVVDNNSAAEIEELLPDGQADDGQRRALISQEALGLVNGFLDTTLFSILATARSGKLKKLRPAVTDVLKPRLAREAIASADEELRELLDGEDEEDAADEASGGPDSGAEGVGDLRKGDSKSQVDDFNLALTWRRTRLRIMVYTRLGDLEDEDEDRFLDDDEEFHHAKENAAGDATSDVDSEAIADLGLVSPAAAIFLTSVIEYLAEQTLIVAGQAALQRTRRRKPSSGPRSPPSKDMSGDPSLQTGFAVLDLDMEKVALNPTLGRLWRTWRKHSRGSNTPVSLHSPGRRGHFGALGPRSIAGESSAWSEADGSRRPSLAVTDAEGLERERLRALSGSKGDVPDTREHSELEMATNIPLPLPEGGDGRDIKEIEVPGLAKQIVDEPGPEAEPKSERKRRASFGQFQATRPARETLTGGQRPVLNRLRSTSTPALAAPQGWLSYLFGSAKPENETAVEDDVAIMADADETNPGPAGDEQNKKEKDDEKSEVGLFAGAAAVVSSAVNAAVGSRGNKSNDETDENTGRVTRKELQLQGKAADLLRKQSSTSTLFEEEYAEAAEMRKGTLVEPQGSQGAVEPPADGRIRPAEAETERPKSRVVMEQEAALLAATNHVKRLSQLPPEFSPSEEEEVSRRHGYRPDYEGAEYGHDEDLGPHEHDFERSKHLSAMPEPLNVSKESSPMTARSANNLLGPVGIVSAGARGPSLPSQDAASRPVPPNQFGAKKLAVSQEQLRETADRRPQKPVVDDDYDPFSSDGYPSTMPSAGIQKSMPAEENFDASAIGVARSSDRAIPYSRSPSPQSFTSSQREKKGIQGQFESSQSQSSNSQQQGPARNVNGATYQSGQHALASAPGHAKEHDRQTAYPSRTTSALQAISNASEKVPERSEKRKPGAAAATAQQQAAKSAEEDPKQNRNQLTAEAAARPNSSKGVARPRGSTSSSNRSGKEGEGLMPRPVDPNRASSENKRRDFEELLNNGEDEPVKYTLTPVRVADESPTGPSQASTKAERQGSSPEPAASSTTTAWDSAPQAPATVDRTPRATSPNTTTTPSSSRHTPSSSQQVTYRTIPTPTHSRKNTQASVARVPGPQPINASIKPSASSRASDSVDPNITADNARGAADDSPSTKKLLKFIAREPRVKGESMRDFADFIRTTGPDREMNVMPIIPRSGSRRSAIRLSNSILTGFTAHGSDSTQGASTENVLGAGANGDARRSTVQRASMQARDPAVKNDGSKDLIHFLREGPPGGSQSSPNPKLVAPFADGKAGRRSGATDSDETNSPLSSSRNSATAPSTNSRTALVDNKAAGGTGQGDGIKKTRRRVKDPYAIDLDDDDEDLLTALPGAQRPRQEESLIDFLRNSEPPTANSPQRLGGVGSGVNGHANGANGTLSSSPSPTATRKMETRPAGATSNAKAARMEASQNTRDLAEFFRDSGPPSSSNMSPQVAGGGGKAAKMLGGGPGLDAGAPGVRRSESKGSGGRVGGGGVRFWKRKNTVDG